MSDVRFKFNPAGYRAIMRSPQVVAMLDGKAAKVAASVRSSYSGPGWQIVHNVQVGRTRARAIVSGVPESEEIADRVMVRSLDAAR